MSTGTTEPLLNSDSAQYWSARLAVAESVESVAKTERHSKHQLTCVGSPNPSIERTCHGRLCLPRHAAHVER